LKEDVGGNDGFVLAVAPLVPKNQDTGESQ
jgi:hypothetical protein